MSQSTNDIGASGPEKITLDTSSRSQTINLGAGPSTLPTSVLLESCRSLLDFDGTGMGITEVSHRSSTFQKVCDHAEAALRQLLNIPDSYAVLFTQGGGTEQFSATVLNLMARHAKLYPDAWRQSQQSGSSGVRGPKADYAISGSWTAKAFKEASRLGFDPHAVFDSRKDGENANGKFGSIPPVSQWRLSDTSGAAPPAFLYYCDNETVDGVEFGSDATGFPVEELPAEYLEKVPLVADMSSNILSRRIPHLEKHALIFFGAQKNVGPSGVTVVIVRKELVVDPDDKLVREVGGPAIPTTLVYKNLVDNKSLYNTPPMFSIYVSGLVFQDLLDNGGGVLAAEQRSREKAKLVYDFIDGSDGLYVGTVKQKDVRSRMNVTFRVCKAGQPDDALEAAFVKLCAAKGIQQVKGHRSVGGIRTSLYNAVTVEQTRVLVQAMKEFAEQVKQGKV